LRSLGRVVGQHLGEKLLELRPIFVKFGEGMLFFQVFLYKDLLVLGKARWMTGMVLFLCGVLVLFMMEKSEKEGVLEHFSTEGILLFSESLNA